MKKYKLIIFDMDGTLADTSLGIINSVRYVQEKMNLPKITLEQMYSHIGPPMEESYNHNFGLTGDMLKCAVKLHKEYAINYGYKEIRWYDGIPELLDEVKANGIITAIASFKAQKTIMKILDYFKMTHKFDIIVGTTDDIFRNKYQLLEYCIENANIPKEQAIFLGDSNYDALGAQYIGIDFIAVMYGFGFKNNELEKFSNMYICNNVNEIKEIINP